MKKLLLLVTAVLATGCTTMKETMRDAKQDFKNFRRTIVYNSKQKAVRSNATFTSTNYPSWEEFMQIR